MKKLKSYLQSTKGQNLVYVSLVFFGFVLVLVLIWALFTKKDRIRKFEKESKPFKVCVKVEHKYRRYNVTTYSVKPKSSKPVVVFKFRNRQCKYIPAVKEWGKLKEGQYYLIEGKASPTICKVYKVLGVCDRHTQKEFPKLDRRPN